MAKDPVCGMEVDEKKAIRVQRDGQDNFFCSSHCKDKFLGQKKERAHHGHSHHLGSGHSMKKEKALLSARGTIYTCPMHPEIEQNHPGDCPKCGMALEPKNATVENTEEQDEIKKLSRKFWEPRNF